MCGKMDTATVLNEPLHADHYALLKWEMQGSPEAGCDDPNMYTRGSGGRRGCQ
jgi:hypothetical protein